MRARAVAVRAVAVVLAAAAAAWVAAALRGRLRRGRVDGARAATAATSSSCVATPAACGRRHRARSTKPGWPRGVLHRVDAVYADGSMRLRGDANPSADREPVAPARVRGVVAAVLPSGRVRAVMRAPRDAVVQSCLTYRIPKAMTERRGREHAPPRREGPHQAVRVPRAASAPAVPSTSRVPEGPATGLRRGGRIPPIRGRRARGPGSASTCAHEVGPRATRGPTGVVPRKPTSVPGHEKMPGGREVGLLSFLRTTREGRQSRWR